VAKRNKVDPEQVALALSGRMKILTEKELMDKHRMGGKLPRFAHFTVKIPAGWELAHPWQGPEDNEDGIVTLFLVEA
jgi:hypothetical protein